MCDPNQIPVQVDPKTYILISKDRDKTTALETFRRRWKEYLDYEEKHAEPFLMK